MKNKVLGWLLVCFLCVSASVTTSMMVVKPAKPKNVYCSVVYYVDVQSVVYKYVKQGYIVKSVSAPNSNSHVTIVMELY